MNIFDPNLSNKPTNSQLGTTFQISFIMHYKYSIPIDEGLEQSIRTYYGTRLPIRISANEQPANTGSDRVVTDWRQSVNTELPTEWNACKSTAGHMVSLMYPEMQPEKIEIMAYMSDYAFLFDGEMPTP